MRSLSEKHCLVSIHQVGNDQNMHDSCNNIEQHREMICMTLPMRLFSWLISHATRTNHEAERLSKGQTRDRDVKSNRADVAREHWLIGPVTNGESRCEYLVTCLNLAKINAKVPILTHFCASFTLRSPQSYLMEVENVKAADPNGGLKAILEILSYSLSQLHISRLPSTHCKPRCATSKLARLLSLCPR